MISACIMFILDLTGKSAPRGQVGRSGKKKFKTARLPNWKFQWYSVGSNKGCVNTLVPGTDMIHFVCYIAMVRQLSYTYHWYCSELSFLVGKFWRFGYFSGPSIGIIYRNHQISYTIISCKLHVACKLGRWIEYRVHQRYYNYRGEEEGEA